MRLGAGLAALFCAMVATGLSPRPTLAQEQAAPPPTVQSPILTISVETLYKETLYGKAVEARFKTDSDALVKENLRLEQALEAEERDLTDRRATLPPAEFKPLATAFDAKAEQIRAAQLAKSRSIARKREVEQQRFLEIARPVLQQLMQETGAAVVLNENMVVARVSGIDITDAAIARMDKMIGDGSSLPDPTEAPAPAP